MDADRNAIIATVLPGYHRWLHRLAYDLLPEDSPDHDDLANEGYIAMWRAFDTYDEAKGALPSWLTGAARLRMRDLAHGHAQWFGHEPVRGSRNVDATSLDAILDAEPDLPVTAAEMLDGVEFAYHHGEIAEAMAALSPAQRSYVYAWFWLGLNPASREPAMKALVDEFPVLRKRWLWTGSTHTVGARERLASQLEHLVSA